MRIKKKQIFALSIIAICIAILATGSLAYFTTEDTAHNIITSGRIDIELIEKTEKSDGTLVDFPEEGIGSVMPGTSVSKLVSVQNVGENEAWLRLSVDVRIISETGKELPMELKGGISAVNYTVDTTQWLYQNGWYYYADRVLPKQVTELFFEEVCFPPEMGNEYQGCVVYIEIEAQAVQSANNGESVMAAKGWPMEVID